MMQSIGGTRRRSRLHALPPKGVEVHEHTLSAKSLDVKPTGLLVGYFEKRLDLIGHESAQWGEAVPIVLSEPMVWHTERRIEVKLVTSPRDSDIEQSLFLLNTFGRTQRHVDGYGTVDDVGDMDNGPLETLGGMDCRDHQV